jgi:flavin reductase ActVB
VVQTVYPSYRLDLVFDAVWQALVGFAPFIAGGIVIMMLATLFAERLKEELAEPRGGGPASVPTAGAATLPQRMLQMLAAASSVHAPLSYATRLQDAASHVDGAPAAADALAQFPAGVCLVTARDLDGEPHGVVLTSLCIHSAVPPSVLLCVRRDAPAHDALLASSAFGVQLLDQDQQRRARLGEQDGDALDGAAWSWDRGLPVVPGAVASLRCELAKAMRHGDHVVVIGNVAEVTTAAGDPAPLVRLRGRTGWRLDDTARAGTQR